MKRLCLVVGLFIAISSLAFTSDTLSQNESVASTGVSQTAKAEIFITSWCPYCRKLETFLKQNQIPYTRYDVEADEKGAEIFKQIGGTGVPVTRVGNIVIRGCDPERIVAALKTQT